MEVVPADTRILESVTAFDAIAVVNQAGWLSEILIPAVLCVIEPEMEPPAKPDDVPAAPPAFRLIPDEFTVHANGPAVNAVFRPTASFDAR